MICQSENHCSLFYRQFALYLMLRRSTYWMESSGQGCVGSWIVCPLGNFPNSNTCYYCLINCSKIAYAWLHCLLQCIISMFLKCLYFLAPYFFVCKIQVHAFHYLGLIPESIRDLGHFWSVIKRASCDFDDYLLDSFRSIALHRWTYPLAYWSPCFQDTCAATCLGLRLRDFEVALVLQTCERSIFSWLPFLSWDAPVPSISLASADSTPRCPWTGGHPPSPRFDWWVWRRWWAYWLWLGCLHSSFLVVGQSMGDCSACHKSMHLCSSCEVDCQTQLSGRRPCWSKRYAGKLGWSFSTLALTRDKICPRTSQVWYVYSFHA